MAEPFFHVFDPAQIIATFNGRLIVGYAEGSFIEAERDEDAWTAKAGATGDVVRVRNRNRMGTVKIVIMSESPSNDDLSLFAVEDELAGAGAGELMIKNLNGSTLLHASDAWVKKLPSVKFDKDATTREWVFHCAQLDMFVGGAIV